MFVGCYVYSYYNMSYHFFACMCCEDKYLKVNTPINKKNTHTKKSKNNSSSHHFAGITKELNGPWAIFFGSKHSIFNEVLTNKSLNRFLM